MTNFPIKRKNLPEESSISTSSDNSDSSTPRKRQRTTYEYPIFSPAYSNISQQDLITYKATNTTPELHFRRIPPTYPFRRLPSLKTRRWTRNQGVRTAQILLNSTSNHSQFYEQYAQSLLKITPKWLREERSNPKHFKGDKWAIAPTEMRFWFMSRPEQKRFRLEYAIKKAIDKMDWNRVHPVKKVKGPARGAVLVEEEDLRKSWTCKMQ